MDVKLIKQMGRKLKGFLGQFNDCFSRREPRSNLFAYVKGQLSDLPRKSIEPIALAAKMVPRTLQNFLSAVPWDHQRMRDRTQWIVATEHSHPRAIGVIDESGSPKKGKHTCGVQRQWCGNTGKVDNCVVGVHLGYVTDDFQCLLDSDLYLPEDWANDLERRRQAKVPDSIVYRKKALIALEQVGRSLNNGVRFSALTFDELYGRDREFLDGMDTLGQNYIGEVPSDFSGWTRQPNILHKPTPSELRKKGRRRHFPRISRQTNHACEVRNLASHSPKFYHQKWKKFKIKDGEKGPVVWEVKAVEFYRKHGPDGLPGRPHTLIVAHNVLNTKEVKYFLSNMIVNHKDITLKWLLWVAFSRWPIERCFEIGKRDLGMDHFETRNWQGIHRHFYITQLSMLFCSRIHQDLREKNSREFVFDSRTGSPSSKCLDYGAMDGAIRPRMLLPVGSVNHRISSTSQPTGQEISLEKNAERSKKVGHNCQQIKELCAV
ncbi:MAG: IS701 family transposase [Chloroflexi bacterium]|nr:IS701 family transposase [Chloroflexota bacterium]